MSLSSAPVLSLLSREQLPDAFGLDVVVVASWKPFSTRRRFSTDPLW